MLHRIVIVGGGAGGLQLATHLGSSLGKRKRAEVVLVDSSLTHVWKPLLHEVAAGSLHSSRDQLDYLAQAKRNNFKFELGRMRGLNRASKTIALDEVVDGDGIVLVPGRLLTYDTLVIAVGSVTNDFRTTGAAEHCIFLDTATEASRFHRLMLKSYLSAEARGKDSSALHVAIVGGGATGVELAAELRTAGRELESYGFTGIRPDNLKITVIDAGPRVLPALSPRISDEVLRRLQTLDITVITNAVISGVTKDELTTADGKVIPAELKVWAAGIRAPDFLTQLDGLETNRINQLVVRSTLQTSLDDSIFALGDCAACPIGDGSNKTVPPRAQAAHQQASLLSKSLTLYIEKGQTLEYRYRDYGSLVSMSRTGAVGNLMGSVIGNVNVEGRFAGLAYSSLYRMHQLALAGVFRTMLKIIGDRLGRKTEQRLKLH